MWSDWPIPPLLQAPGIRRLSDIPLDASWARSGAWCAYYESDLSFFDCQGVIHPRRHTYAGLAADPRQAQFFCMMEAAERVSGLSSDVMRGLAFRSCPSGAARHWRDFSPYSERQWTWNASYPNSTPTWWVRSHGVSTGTPVNVPADSVFPWWRSYAGRTALLPEGEGGGFAAGFAWEHAACAQRALCEVIERDAAMLSWRVASWPARRIAPGLASAGLQAQAAASGLRLELFDVGDPALMPVVIALLSREDSEVVLGASCALPLSRAVDKAIREAFMLRGTVQLLDVTTPTLTASNVQDSADHLVYAWRNSKPVLDWYRRKGALPAPPSGPGDRLPARCAAVFGAEPLIVDVTHPQLAMLQLHVVRILQPHAFRKEYRHAWRYEGGARLQALGIGPDDLHDAPHPIG
jgi:ribosomal protein S12 methylthiotransferase accessory factor YcaO